MKSSPSSGNLAEEAHFCKYLSLSRVEIRGEGVQSLLAGCVVLVGELLKTVCETFAARGSTATFYITSPGLSGRQSELAGSQTLARGGDVLEKLNLFTFALFV